MRDLAIPRASGLLSAWLVSSVAALSATSAVPTWSGGMQWEPGLIDAALAGAAVILALFLVAMVRLAILDWLAERWSCRAWTVIGAHADEVATAPVVEGPEQSGHCLRSGSARPGGMGHLARPSSCRPAEPHGGCPRHRKPGPGGLACKTPFCPARLSSQHQGARAKEETMLSRRRAMEFATTTKSEGKRGRSSVQLRRLQR